MASNGTMQGNSVTVTGGGNAGNYFFINWQLAGQDITNNTSTINWQAYFHFNGDDSQLNNGVAALSGTRWSNGGRVYSYSGNFSTRDLQLSAGSFTIGHNSDGTQSISVSGGIDVYQSGRSQGSAGWSLPTIPRNSQVTTSASSYTLGSPVVINTNRKSGSFTHTITLRMDNAAGTVLQTQNNVTDSWTWTPTSTQITDMQNHIPNSNTLTLYINQYNNQVKASSSATVALNLTDANPTFTDFTFKDNNSAVATITGNNQVLVKGQSSLLVTVPAASKLIANKGATADHYAITYDGTTNQTAYATTDVTSSFTPIVSVGDRTILVGAYDSRGNSTTVSKLITVYDYVAPTISTSLTRLNNFDANTTVHIEGTYTPLVIGGANKNALTTGTLQYRYQEDGGTFGSWVTKTFTADTTAGTFSVTDFVVSLDNTKKYNFEFHISDKFGQVTTTNSVDVGTPIMFVGTDGYTAFNGKSIFDMIYPVGAIYMSVNNTNPGTLFGGTWSAWGSGRVPVGVDVAQSEFNAVEKTGGEKTHTLTVAEMPSHTHAIPGTGVIAGGSSFTGYVANSNGQTTIGFSGGGAAHNNLQPYIICYMWKRTS